MKNSKIYPWIVVGLLWGVALLNYMDRQMLSTMKEAMQVDITELQSATNFGYLMAIFLWIYALMSPVSGIIADRLSRKWLIVGSLFVWSSVTYLMGIANTFDQIVWLRALMGVSEALYIPAGLSLICEKACPFNAITIYKGIYSKVDFDKCVGCSKCAKACPASTIEVK